jgi:hypothetical protein
MGEDTQPYREATRVRTPQILVIPAKAGFQRPSFFLFFVASWLCARYFSFARSHKEELDSRPAAASIKGREATD